MAAEDGRATTADDHGEHEHEHENEHENVYGPPDLLDGGALLADNGQAVVHP